MKTSVSVRPSLPLVFLPHGSVLPAALCSSCGGVLKRMTIACSAQKKICKPLVLLRGRLRRVAAGLKSFCPQHQPVLTPITGFTEPC